MSTTQEEISKSPASIREHYEAAKAAQSSDQGAEETETTPDETSTPPAEDPAKPADQPDETGESEDALALATKEEIAQLTPHHKKLYEKMQKDYTQKTQKLSAERKEMEQWKPLIESFKTDPATALDQVARQLGYSITKPNQDTTAKEQAKEIVDQLPEGLEFLDPHLQSRIQKALDQRLKPIEERHQQMAAETAQAETKATLEAFSSKYKDWHKHEPAMLAVMRKLEPRGMTDFEFMELAYRNVTADINKAEETKKVVAKIEKSAAAAESTTAGMPESRVAFKKPVGLSTHEVVRAAHKAAQSGQVWED